MSDHKQTTPPVADKAIAALERNPRLIRCELKSNREGDEWYLVFTLWCIKYYHKGEDGLLISYTYWGHEERGFIMDHGVHRKSECRYIHYECPDNSTDRKAENDRVSRFLLDSIQRSGCEHIVEQDLFSSKDFVGVSVRPKKKREIVPSSPLLLPYYGIMLGNLSCAIGYTEQASVSFSSESAEALREVWRQLSRHVQCLRQPLLK